ncbi:MAG: M20/M25/M40 family metallo-hydrolase [Desulfobacterales bacterium]
MINRERLIDTFRFLAKIDSVSRHEGDIAKELKKILESMGAQTVVDGAGKKTGSDTGNLIARFHGTEKIPPLLLNAHMDTVEPGRGVVPVLKDGMFTSDGTTILGADDKSAIAVLIEVMRVLKENNMPYGPIEMIFTICEEIGLMGAKHMDMSLITAKYGYALDATDTEGIITHAPSANKLDIKIHGRDAHAGAAPEKGINAIHLASKAIAALQLGRIDKETTCNIGIINGGIATNIIPNLVSIKGEVRSHSDEKLKRVTGDIISSFENAVKNYGIDSSDGLPRVEVIVEDDFLRTDIPENHPVVVLAQKAAANLGRKMITKITGGGADANIFYQKGIVTGVIGTGMRDMHTVRESVSVDDMIKTGDLVLEIIRLHTQNPLPVTW